MSRSSSVTLAHEATPPPPPALGDPILVFQKQWLDKILSGQKTMEIRHQCLKAGYRYLASGQKIHARAFLGAGAPVHSSEWHLLLSRHCVDTQEMPYARTCAHDITGLQLLAEPLPYKYQLGQVGTATFVPIVASRRVDESLMAAEKKRKRPRSLSSSTAKL